MLKKSWKSNCGKVNGEDIALWGDGNYTYSTPTSCILWEVVIDSQRNELYSIERQGDEL